MCTLSCFLAYRGTFEGISSCFSIWRAASRAFHVFFHWKGTIKGNLSCYIDCRGTLEGTSAAFFFEPWWMGVRVFFCWKNVLLESFVIIEKDLSKLALIWSPNYLYFPPWIMFSAPVSGESPLALHSERFRISFTKHEAVVLDGSSGRVVTFGTAYRLDEYVCGWPSNCTHTGTISPSSSIQAGDALFPIRNQNKRPFQTVIFFFVWIILTIWKNSNINKKVAISETIWFPLHHMKLCPTRDVSHRGLMSLFFS